MTAGVALPSKPRARCGMCGGRVRIRPGTWNPWVECTSCKGWSASEPSGGTIGHHLRVVLAVPTWTWWRLFGPTRHLSGLPYQCRARLWHRVGWHTWVHSPTKGTGCSWCGKRRTT